MSLHLLTAEDGGLQRRVAGVVLGVCCLAASCLHRHAKVQPATAPVSEPQTAESRPGVPPSTPSEPRTPTPRPAVPPATKSVPIIQGEQGIASWYGHPFHGRPTANGETYDMYQMTAAHRTLPFGTMVRVQNLENGRSVLVRINDRGPFVNGRIIDLSYRAAQDIEMSGIAQVRLDIVGLEPGAPPGIFGVQVGAFLDQNNAQRLRARIEPKFGPVMIQGFDRGKGYFYRVRVGHVNTEGKARRLATELRRAGLATETFVVRLN